MEKWASKWLEMCSQIHRFYKIFRGRPPAPLMRGGLTPPLVKPPLILSPSPSRLSPLGSRLRLPVSPGNTISGSGPDMRVIDKEPGREAVQVLVLFRFCHHWHTSYKPTSKGNPSPLPSDRINAHHHTSIILTHF